MEPLYAIVIGCAAVAVIAIATRYFEKRSEKKGRDAVQKKSVR